MSVCSFCGKDQKDVGLLILGPNGANICNECVKICYNLILDADKKTTLPRILSLPAPPQVIQTICICKIASQTKTAMQKHDRFRFVILF